MMENKNNEQIDKLKEENKRLKVELKKLEKFKEVAEKNEKDEETVYFVEPLKIDDETFEKLTFRRPMGRDIRSVGTTDGIAATYQLARVLCSHLNDVSDDEFDEMDWQRHLKHLIGAVDGFM